MERRTKEGMKAKYNYITKYQKNNYSMFSAQLKKEEYIDLKELLRAKGMTNADFVRWATEKIRSI